MVSRVCGLVNAINGGDGYNVELQTDMVKDNGIAIDSTLAPDGGTVVINGNEEGEIPRSILGVSDRFVPEFYVDFDVPSALRSYIGFPMSLTFSLFKGIIDTKSTPVTVQSFSVDTGELLDEAVGYVVQMQQPTDGIFKGYYTNLAFAVRGILRDYIPTIRIKCAWFKTGVSAGSHWLNIECAYATSGIAPPAALSVVGSGVVVKRSSSSSFDFELL